MIIEGFFLKSKHVNENQYKVTISKDGQSMSFNFWDSILNTIDEIEILPEALNCFLHDCICGDLTFIDFCAEFDCDTDSIKDHNLWMRMRRARKNFLKKFPNVDIESFYNKLAEEY